MKTVAQLLAEANKKDPAHPSYEDQRTYVDSVICPVCRVESDERYLCPICRVDLSEGGKTK
jgi:hypothetical protein